MNTRWIIMLVIIGFIAMFIIQNTVVVKIQFLFWAIEMSRALLIFMLLAIGVIIGWLLHEFMIHKKSMAKQK